jgi:hypothetical protein
VVGASEGKDGCIVLNEKLLRAVRYQINQWPLEKERERKIIYIHHPTPTLLIKPFLIIITPVFNISCL